MSKPVFLDTSFAIALSAPADKFHSRANILAEQLETHLTQGLGNSP
jgi:predicted nucleic acid-binding protein